MAKVNIQITSDLHLESQLPGEQYVFTINPKAPYLALLGDIGLVKDSAYFTFLEAQLLKFQIVFLLLGNHEPYHSSLEEAKSKMRDFETSSLQKHQENNLVGKFVFLDQTRYDISSDVTILGCTLYSQITPAQSSIIQQYVPDFHNISSWDISLHNNAFASDLSWLIPSPTLDKRTYDPQHEGSPASSNFATDLSKEECWIDKNVGIWAWGHTHWNCDFVDGEEKEKSIANDEPGGNEEGGWVGKRCLTDQRGYYFEKSEDFEGGKVIEL